MLSLSPFLRIGIMIAIVSIGLSMLSWGFPYGAELNDTPFGLYLGTALIAGALWMWVPPQIKSGESSRSALLCILIIGLVARGTMFLSTPVLEDDSYRYLWDGAVSARGLDPYEYAPGDASSAPLLGNPQDAASEARLEAHKMLAANHPEVHSRINYPFVSTIYPPATQAAFAIAHFIDPFGLTGWRLMLLATDLATFVLLVSLLRAYGRASEWAAVYWWNPVIILQGFGAGHMDLLVLPFLLATLLFANQRKLHWAVICLAGAVGIKIWPALLLPLILRPALFQPARLIGLSILFGLASAAILAPQLAHVFSPEAGLNAYASDWRTHAFLFSILEDGVFQAFDDPGQTARLASTIIVLGATGVMALRFADNPDRLPLLVTIAIASLIFLSPTGYPWYLIWLAPFLSFVPNRGLQCLMLTAPLYWLRFQLGDDALLYQWAIVPIAFGLPLLLVAYSLQKKEIQDEIRHHHSRAQ